MKRLTLLTIVLFAALILAACGSSSASSSSSYSAPDTSRCTPASTAQIQAIQAGISDIEPGNKATHVWAVKSKDFNNVWMIAASIEGEGITPGQAIGVWAMGGSPSQPSLILAVNGYAKSFSSYPDAAKTKAAIQLNDDGVQEAINCVKAHLP